MGKKKTNRFDLSGDYGIGYFENGGQFIFDLEDFEPYIKNRYWVQHSCGYAVSFHYTRNEDGKRVHHAIRLHRLLLQAPPDKEVDHINGDRLDYRSRNLRICESQENDCNKGTLERNTSGVTGVCFDKLNERWRAFITYQRTRYDIGRFDSFDEAVEARQRKEKELFGNFSRGVIEGRIT